MLLACNYPKPKYQFFLLVLSLLLARPRQSLLSLHMTKSREARSKNCVVIYSFTVIVLHRAVLENHFAL